MNTENITIEERIYCDSNGFYNSQLRFLPIEPWDAVANEGWRTFYTSPSFDNAKQKCCNSETVEVVYAERFII